MHARLARSLRSAVLPFGLAAALAGAAAAQCPEEGPLANHGGAGTTACPCFVTGEQAGVILQAPANHYPIEILKIRVGWGSLFGGTGQSLEQALHIYPAGLPTPGSPQFSLAGPVLTDGFLNEFDISSIPGNKIVNSGPFMVSLQLANDSDLFGGAPVHDGAGCTPGRNSVFAIPGGWTDACGLGVSGNWFMEVTYRQVNCCGTAAVGSRNPGSNPASYTVGGTPSLGGTLTLSVDLSTTGHNRGVVLGYLSRSTSTLGGGQQVLVNASDPNGEILGFPLLGQPVVYRGALPTDTALCGLTLYTQALHVTGVRPFALSNAQDLLLGN